MVKYPLPFFWYLFMVVNAAGSNGRKPAHCAEPRSKAPEYPLTQVRVLVVGWNAEKILFFFFFLDGATPMCVNLF